jgi:hypothetical protein
VTSTNRTITVGSGSVFTAIFTNTLPLEVLTPKVWEREFGGTAIDFTRVGRLTSDGGLILGSGSQSGINGNKTSPSRGDYDYWVIKLDDEGNREWEQTYGGTDTDELWDVQETTDGGFLLAGDSRSPVSGNKTNSNPGATWDGWLIKVDGLGNKLWERSYGGNGEDGFRVIRATSDGGFILGGYTSSTSGGNMTVFAVGDYDFWLMKVDALGVKQWEKTFGGTSRDVLLSLELTKEGGLIICGDSASNNGNKTAPAYGGSDYWVIKTDALGQRQWEKSYGGIANDNPRTIVQLADGGFAVGGDSISGVGGNKTASNFGEEDFWLLRLDQTGEKVWERSFGGDYHDSASQLAQTADGGLLVAGVSKSGVSGNKTTPHFGESLRMDIWLLKLDEGGNKRWERNLGGDNPDYVNKGGLVLAPDDCVVLPGYSISGISGTKTLPNFGSNTDDSWSQKLHLRELPIGTPVVLVNGACSPTDYFAVPATNVSVQVSLQTSFTNSYLFYTLDGTVPVPYEPNTFTYAEPGSPGSAFVNSNSTVIRAVAYDENGENEVHADPVVISVVPVYNLTNTTPGGGDVTMSPAGGIYWSNTVVTLTATPSNGWTFLRWEGDVTGTNNPVTFTLNASGSIQAVFGTEISTNISPVGSGTVSLWPPTGPYAFGSSVRLTPVPANTHRFNRWFNNISGPTTNPLIHTVTTANTNINTYFATLTANNFTLTAIPNGYGAVARSTSANQYPSNTVVTLTALPDAGYVFTGWSGNASGLSNPINVTLNSNKVVTASFVIAGSETNQPPSIAITNPASLATFTAPTNIIINTTNQDSDGSVTQVVFRAGASLIGTVSTAPFNLTWTNAPVGTNALTAVATDNGGLSTTSAPVSVVVETALPQIVLTAPTNNAAFFTPANVTITAIASDADNSISNVTFYAGTNLLTTFTAQPYTFVWSNVAVGSYALSSRVQDNYGPIVTSAPVNITVSAPPGTNPPVFRFNPGSYAVNASNGSVTLTVVNDGDLGGLVNFTTLDGTAYGGSGYSGDYTTQLGSLTFTNGQQSKTITIGIRNNFLNAPDVAFQVQLFQPSAGTLGSPAVATVTIQRNDPSGATNSLTTIAVGSGQPATSGALQVMLTPPEAGGQWRFPWDLGWRTNGATASSLETENYPIEFRNVSNHVAFPATITVAITNGGTTPAVGEYYPGLDSGGAGVGSLTVNISPNAPVGSGWRLFGEAGYRAPNSTATSLLPDTYFVEFAPVAGWTRPATRAVEVAAGQGTTVFDNYSLPQSLPPGAGIPGQLLHSQIVNPASFPYWFNGQLQTDVGFGSGVVVRETVVLTAAHMVFNDVTLSYVNRAWWHYQKEAGVFDPKPNEARGWYVLSGYAAQRTNDIPNPPTGAGVSSAASRNLDVAALYFTAPAARGGFGGYLASDVVPNPWLTDAAKNKMLVGYPVDGSLFGQSVQSGRMYATPLQTTALNHATNQTYTTASFIGHPGNSGGPVYVAFNGYYYPAAVYLGTLGSGVNSVSAVRAINSDVVNLINLASSLGDAGTNNNGGGVITLLAPSVSAVKPAYVQVLFGPPAAVQAGAGWRLSGDATYGTATNYIRTITTTNATIEFKPLVGWNSPSISSYTVQAGALTTIPAANYTPIVPASPSWLFLPGSGFGLSGTTNTKYRIEYTTNLASGLWSPLQTNTITTSGFNLVLPWPPTNNAREVYFRALWLP